jgi:CubicO group peptidase (beta-lactamase class C family)
MMLDFSKIETRIEREMAVARVPGFALAIVRGDEVLYARGFGVTSAEDGLPVTPDTLFCVGSISKVLTALTVVRLVESGLLDFDAPVTEYVPWLTFSRPEYASRVTLRRLLSHSSGLFGTAGNFGPRDPSGLGSFIRNAIPRAQFVAEPGKVFEYSSLGVDLAGYAAEVAAGCYFAATVQRYVLGPLTMNRTTYDRTVAMTYPVALPHTVDDDGTVRVMHRMFDYAAANPAAQAMSSVRDLAQVAIMLLNSGRMAGQQFLRPESVADVLSPQVSLRDLTGSGHGLGFWLLRYGSFEWVTHAGLLTPYLCEFSVFPQAGIGVIFACNATSGFDPHAIRSEIVDHLVGPRQPVTWAPGVRMGENADLSRYAGTYVSLAAGFATLEVAQGELVLQRPDGNVSLYAVDDHTFSDFDGTVVVGFVPEEGRPPQHFILDEHVYQRTDPKTLPRLDASILAAYAGTYRFDDGDTLRIELDDHRLRASFSWLAREYECVPLDRTHFVSPAGVIEFQPVSQQGYVVQYLGAITAARVDEGPYE